MNGRILILDDDPLLAMDVCVTLEEAGFAVLGPSHSVGEALALIEGELPDAAVLDVNLGQETSVPVALRLRELQVPFLLLSGYETNSLPPELQNATYLSKPFLEKQLVRNVTSLVEAQTRVTPE